MSHSIRRVIACVFAASMASLAGCGAGGECGTVLTILAKMGPTRNIAELTACEWQTLFAELPVVAQEFGLDTQSWQVPTLTDEQAQELVDFIDNHGFVTLDDLYQAVEAGTLTLDDIPPLLVELLP